MLMLARPFVRTVVLSCIALSAACDGGSQEAAIEGDTEINLVISDPATAPEEILLLIDFVSYRITCPDSGLTPYDDSVDLAGNFEVDATRDPPIWELVTSLPPSNPNDPPSECVISLWVFYEDEVICSGSQLLDIVEGGDPSTDNKADVVLECNLSVKPPSGDADIDGSFDFVHGNYCPQVFWLGSYPSPDPLVMNIQTRSLDVDGTCGQNCDPQTCDFNTNPPTCSPAPDPGMVTSTLSAPARNGTFGDANALDTTYACDPLLPGPTEICVLVSDGDNDCDRMLCMTVVCPDLCEGVVCDDVDQNGNPNECTRDRCDPLTGLCSNDPAPDGIACANCTSTCGAGVCLSPAVPFTAVQVGSALNGNLSFDGTMQQVNMTLVNPYSGASIPISGPFNYNISSYLGDTLNDVLMGTALGDFLLVQDPVGTQRICGVETILAQNSFDVMILADSSIILGDMVIEGGNHPDLIWANAGNDTLLLNNGADFADGGPGDDIIEGGNGNDIVTLWPGSGFDSIAGGGGIVDRVEIYAIQSQILITPNLSGYEFDIFYLGTPMAQIMEVEFLDMNDASIDLATCTGPLGDVCNLCGNDALNGGEGCDDGNNVDGDGCAADCVAEY
jgi:cysteine-rich repeat protein